MKMRFLSEAFLALMLSTTIASAQQASDTVAPEKATAVATARRVESRSFMVAAANPLAAEAGRDVIAAGGNAIDAMVAVQTVLGLVEPQSSGLGGGAFLVYYHAKSGKLTTLDGRETAPMDATPKLFLDDKGQPLKFMDAVVGGRSVGTPGTVRLLEEAHKRYGKADWASLLKPAETLATEGFKVSPRLASLIASEGDRLKKYPEARSYFFDTAGAALQTGALLKNPAYAETLATLAKSGADAFYEGRIAEAVVKTVREAADNPGVLSLSDLSNYRVIEREPVCFIYRALDVCGMGPPSSGGIAIDQMLGMAENFDLKSLGPKNVESWRLIGDAQRLAFADRERYVADTDFVPLPIKGLLDKTYLGERAKLLDGERALAKDAVKAGEPEWDHALLFGRNGFLLNNELTDFSFKTHDGGLPIANRVEPGKRPRSSMAPTIVMKDGKPLLAIGSPGGSQIIGYVAQALIAYIDWGMPVEAIVAQPHLINRFGTYDIEAGTSAEDLVEPLKALGYEVKPGEMNSGLHAIEITAQGLAGSADPRREGAVMGE